MGKLILVIADNDENYIKSLENYILAHYSQRFEIYSFSIAEYLTDFLDKSKKNINILLINRAFLYEAFPLQKVEIPIILEDFNCKSTPDSFEAVFKYQHAEKIISQIFSIYSQKNCKEIQLHKGKIKDTIVVAVFSSSGGSGKTCIAAGCSMLCARKGLKSFYLNLENIPSTGFYFKNTWQQNFSNIIYYLKEKDNNLQLKIEGARCIDQDSNVHYFLPPDSFMEMEEVMPEDIELLIRELRTISQYDVVFIDMSSVINQRNLSIFKACDVIIKISLPNEYSLHKNITLSKDFDILEKTHSLDLTNKTIDVFNRYREVTGDINAITTGKATIKITINESEKLKLYMGDKQLVDVDTDFSAALNQLIENIIPVREK